MARLRARKIAVIGTINFDSVIRADQSRAQGYGGILYNLRVLSQLVDERTSIFPTANVGTDRDREIRSLLSALPQVRPDALRTVPAKNNHCRLRYSSLADKTEILYGWVGGVARSQLGKIVDSEAILVNFISGCDISTRNLLWLRQHTPAVIYMDFHSRTLCRRRDGTRFLRRPRDWQVTVGCADILQMNDVEFRLLAGTVPNPDTCRRFVGQLLPNAQGLLVTSGERGCLATFRRARGLEVEQLRARSPRAVVDTTGCGDIFAGAFLSSWLRGLSFMQSARLAVRMATFRVGHGDLADIDFASCARGS